MGVVFGFVLESDFTAKLGGKWRPKRSPKLKLVLHWGSSSEELPKTIHANYPSFITKKCILSARKVMATMGPGLWANGRKIYPKVINKV